MFQCAIVGDTIVQSKHHSNRPIILDVYLDHTAQQQCTLMLWYRTSVIDKRA